MQKICINTTHMLTVATVDFTPEAQGACNTLRLHDENGIDLTTAHYDVLKITTSASKLVIAGLKPANPCAHVIIDDGTTDKHFPLLGVSVFDSEFEVMDIHANIYDITLAKTHIDALNLRNLPPAFFPCHMREKNDDHVMHVCTTSALPSADACKKLADSGVIIRRYGDVIPV